MKAIRYGLIAALVLISSSVSAQTYSVFEYLQEGLTQPADEAVNTLVASAETQGFEVLSVEEMAVPEGCSSTVTVLSLHNAGYAEALMALGAATAPFAVVDRLVVFADQRGTHAAMVNPPGVVRTIMVDQQAATQVAVGHAGLLRTVGAALTPDLSGRGYGPERERGLIGKTMGVMAGGPFDEKIQTHGTVDGASVASVASSLESAFAVAGPTWGMHFLYRLDIEDAGVVVIGVSGSAVEAKSFDIVKAGNDGSRKDLSCPGIAHAAAYPLEIVVRQVGPDVEVQFVDAMYRMKLFFEDAGKWAFMKNMTMPGSIADELKTIIEKALESAEL